MKTPARGMRAHAVILMFIVTAFSGFAQPRIDRILNGDWKFLRSDVARGEAVKFEDKGWTSVSVPHTWNAFDGQDGGNDYYRGVGWYRKRFVLSAHEKGGSIFLKFDGASSVSSVYVNGRLAGIHKGMFGAFCFDVTPLVEPDAENIIAVKVTNAPDSTVAPLHADFTMYGGIYRNVHLLVLDNLSISPLDDASPGVYARQVHVSPEGAELEVTTIVRNATSDVRHASLQCSLFGQSGEQLKTVDMPVTVSPRSSQRFVELVSIHAPRLWNGRRDPYLHRLTVELREGSVVKDRVEQPIGLRYFRIDPEKGFILNGKSYPLHGVNRHQDRENMGWAIGRKEHEEDYRLIEELGCTAVRLAHYQHAQEFYDFCDRGGMVVWAELALVDEINASPEFASVCKQQLRELIKQNYNHPSIIFWSLFNELLPENHHGMYARVVAELDTLAKSLDPTRLTAGATRSRYGMDEPMNSVTDVIGYNIYKGWYEGSPEDLAPFLDTLHLHYPRRPFCVSEYGAGAGMTQHEIPPSKPRTDGPWHPEEWQSLFHEVSWNAMAARPYIWGTFVWNMFDFGSDGRKEGEHNGRNDKGLVTYDRKTKKDAFFWYKANWNPDPMVHIASQRYAQRPFGPAQVKVYSNCDSVTLSVNGLPLAKGTRSGRCFFWTAVGLKAGRNIIEASGTKGGSTFLDSCVLEGVQGH